MFASLSPVYIAYFILIHLILFYVRLLFFSLTFSSCRVHRHDTEESLRGATNVRHKIVVMGGAKVGKTSLINQFLYNRFSPKYKRTVEEMHQGTFSISGVSLTLDILDTSGAYEVIMFDVFHSCARFIRQHKRRCSSNSLRPLVLSS